MPTLVIRHRVKTALLRRINLLRGKRTTHLLHVGKTGGTAVKAAISGSPEARQSVILHPHQVTLRNIARGDKVIVFVRDPIDRFISGFYSRKRQGRPAHDVPWTRAERRAFERFATPNDLAAAISSADESLKHEATAAMTSIEHVRSSYWDWFISEEYMASRWNDVIFIGQLETIKDDFERLKELMSWPSELALPYDASASHKGPTGEDRSLGQEATRNLERWFAADYRFLQLCARRRIAAMAEPFAVSYPSPDASSNGSS